MRTKPLEDIKIAPKLDRITHEPIGGYWKVIDFPRSQEWDEDDWETAIDIFEDRIYGRFINLVREIENLPNSGFSVMALDCLLVETLQQFREGKGKTPKNKGAEYFGKFLTQTKFQSGFGKTYGDDTLAHRFYVQIRCGILHQAETMTDSRIIYSQSTKEIVKPTEKGILVNRYAFHEMLIKVFDDFVQRLRNSLLPDDSNLREPFKKKMKYICRLEFEE